MSYEIYYDRAFIRVGDKYIPLVNQGSNNTWQANWNGRYVPDKNWQVLNWRDRSRLLFTEAEVREIAKDYEEISQSSGTCFKTRNRQFAPGEFERWLLCGLKSAKTIEEYVLYGNSLEINDFSGAYDDWVQYPFSTTEELLTLIDKLNGRTSLNVHFQDNRQVYRPKRAIAPPKDYRQQDTYYVLCSSGEAFFCSLKKRGYSYVKNVEHSAVRVFGSEKNAQRYLNKYNKRLSCMSVMCVEAAS